MTRTLAAALTMGLLATSNGSPLAHAQTQLVAGDRYSARIPGAQVSFYRADHISDGTSIYTYNVTSRAWGGAAGFYAVEPGFRSLAAVRFGNDRMFRALQDTLKGARAAHRAGVWFVQAQQGITCTLGAGTLWRRTTFMVYATGPGCTSAAQVLAAQFAGVSRLLGRHSPAGIPWLAAAVRVRPAALPQPTATPLPLPTATPVPQPEYLAQLSGSQNAESDTFTASGAFMIDWSADLDNTDLGFGFFSLALYSATDNLPVDSIASTTTAGSGNYLVHADCSQGCYLKVQSSNMTYSAIAA